MDIFEKIFASLCVLNITKGMRAHMVPLIGYLKKQMKFFRSTLYSDCLMAVTVKLWKEIIKVGPHTIPDLIYFICVSRERLWLNPLFGCLAINARCNLKVDPKRIHYLCRFVWIDSFVHLVESWLFFRSWGRGFVRLGHWKICLCSKKCLWKIKTFSRETQGVLFKESAIWIFSFLFT